MEEGKSLMSIVCPVPVVETTLRRLQSSGRRGHEGIVLWLGKRAGDGIDVSECYEPEHVARRDIFRILPAAMRTLLVHLRKNRLMIAAQVHSHPKTAFHSEADDEWAIVRHVGALSIVAPYFAAGLAAETFLNACATFELSSTNRWIEVPAAAVASRIQIV